MPLCELCSDVLLRPPLAPSDRADAGWLAAESRGGSFPMLQPPYHMASKIFTFTFAYQPGR